MDIEVLRKFVRLVPLVFFRLQAESDRLHAARALSTGLRGVLLSLQDLGPMTASRLADIRPVSRQAVHMMAEQLIARGLIRQVRNPHDRRAPLLMLTGKGRGEITRLRGAEDPILTILFQGVAPSDISAAIRTLELIGERLSSEKVQKLQVVAPEGATRKVMRQRRVRA